MRLGGMGQNRYTVVSFKSFVPTPSKWALHSSMWHMSPAATEHPYGGMSLCMAFRALEDKNLKFLLIFKYEIDLHPWAILHIWFTIWRRY